MLKKVISLLVLVMYLHGMSGYSMNFHKCSITGFEKVYAGYDVTDPCGEEDEDCEETIPHFERADCCDVDQTFVKVDDDNNLTDPAKKTLAAFMLSSYGVFIDVNAGFNNQLLILAADLPPPDISVLNCVFRI